MRVQEHLLPEPPKHLAAKGAVGARPHGMLHGEAVEHGADGHRHKTFQPIIGRAFAMISDERGYERNCAVQDGPPEPHPIVTSCIYDFVGKLHADFLGRHNGARPEDRGDS